MPVRSTFFPFFCKTQPSLPPFFIPVFLPLPPFLPFFLLSFCPHPLPRVASPLLASLRPERSLTPPLTEVSCSASQWPAGVAALLLQEGRATTLPQWNASFVRAGGGGGFVYCLSCSGGLRRAGQWEHLPDGEKYFICHCLNHKHSVAITAD